MVSLLQTSGVFLQLRTYFTPCSSVSMVNFEHVLAGWDCCYFLRNFASFFNQQLTVYLPAHQTLPASCILKSCIKIKINIKPFEAPPRNVKTKLLS